MRLSVALRRQPLSHRSPTLILQSIMTKVLISINCSQRPIFQSSKRNILITLTMTLPLMNFPQITLLMQLCKAITKPSMHHSCTMLLKKLTHRLNLRMLLICKKSSATLILTNVKTKMLSLTSDQASTMIRIGMRLIKCFCPNRNCLRLAK